MEYQGDPTKPPCSKADPKQFSSGQPGAQGVPYTVLVEGLTLDVPVVGAPPVALHVGDVVYCTGVPQQPPDDSFRIGGENGQQYKVEGTFVDRNGMTGPIEFSRLITHDAVAWGRFPDTGLEMPAIFVAVTGGIEPGPNGTWIVSTDGSAQVAIARLSAESFKLKITDTKSGKTWTHDFPQDENLTIMEHAFAAA
jgi:hypothetical protein